MISTGEVTSKVQVKESDSSAEYIRGYLENAQRQLSIVTDRLEEKLERFSTSVESSVEDEGDVATRPEYFMALEAQVLLIIKSIRRIENIIDHLDL